MAMKWTIETCFEVSQLVPCGKGQHDVVLQMTPWSVEVAFNPCELLPLAAQLLSDSRCRHETTKLKKAACAIVSGQWLGDELYLTLLQEIEQTTCPQMIDYALQFYEARIRIAREILAHGGSQHELSSGASVTNGDMVDEMLQPVPLTRALLGDCDARRWAALTLIRDDEPQVSSDHLQMCWTLAHQWPIAHRLGLLSVASGTDAEERTWILCELAFDRNVLSSLRVQLLKELQAIAGLAHCSVLLQKVVRDESVEDEPVVNGAIVHTLRDSLERACSNEAEWPQVKEVVRQLLTCSDHSPWLLRVFVDCSDKLFDVILELAQRRVSRDATCADASKVESARMNAAAAHFQNDAAMEMGQCRVASKGTEAACSESLKAVRAISHAPVERAGPALLELYLTNEATAGFHDEVASRLEAVVREIREYNAKVVAFLQMVIWKIDSGTLLYYAVQRMSGADTQEACRTLMSRLPTIPRTGMRGAFIETLGRIGSAEALGVLMDEYDAASRDAPKTVAADSIASILERCAADDIAVETLHRTLHSGDFHVACASARLLSEHSSVDATTVLTRALSDGELSHELKMQVLAALREREDLTGILDIVKYLENCDDELLESAMNTACGLLHVMKREKKLETRGLTAALRSACLPVARAAAEVLKVHPDRRWAPELLNCILRGDPALAQNAGAALIDWVDSTAIEGMIRHWMYGDACVSRSIEAAVSQFGSKAVRHLVKATHWRFAPARLHALRALVAIGGPAADNALKVALTDSNPTIRRFAHTALAGLANGLTP